MMFNSISNNSKLLVKQIRKGFQFVDVCESQEQFRSYKSGYSCNTLIMPNYGTVRKDLKYFYFLNPFRMDFMSKDKSLQLFNLKLLVMKKISFYLLVLIASFILVNKSYGQSVLIDSIKTDLKLSEDIVEKLDSKEIVELIKFKEQLLNDNEMATKFAVDPTEVIGKFVPLMPIIVFTFILLILCIPFYFNFKKAKGRQLIISNLIEKGQEIPKELLTPSKKNIRSDFHKGVILASLGLSICIVLFVLEIANNYWTIGLIPIFIGIGYLISFKFDKSNKDRSEVE